MPLIGGNERRDVRGLVQPGEAEVSPPQVFPPTESRDSRSLVQLRVSGPQPRVSDVIVSSDWNQRTSADELAHAILEAALTPQLRSVSDRLDAAIAATGAASVPPTERRSPSNKNPIGEDEFRSMLGGLHRAISAVDDALASPSDTTSAAIVGTDRHRIVEVSLIAGRLHTVTIDPTRAAPSGRQGLSDALNQAFEDAYTQEDLSHENTEPGGEGSWGEVARDMQSIVGRFTI